MKTFVVIALFAIVLIMCSLTGVASHPLAKGIDDDIKHIDTEVQYAQCHLMKDDTWD